MSDGQILAAAPAEAAPANQTPATPTAPDAAKAADVTQKADAPSGILPDAGAEQKPVEGEQAKATEAAPAEFEVKLPDGVEADPVLTGVLKDLVKDSGLKSDAAQKLVDAYVKSQKDSLEAARSQWETTKKGWVDSVRKDEEIGGAKFAETVKVANRALEKFATPGLRQVLEDTGLNNHPEVARLFARIGRTLMEDTIAGSSGAPVTANGEEAVYRSLYPTMFKDKE